MSTMKINNQTRMYIANTEIIYIYIYIYIYNPSAPGGYDTRSIFKRVLT